jgi:outer membrane protein assembly complex protein YaeT
MMLNHLRALIPSLVGVSLLCLPGAAARAGSASPQNLQSLEGQQLVAVRVVDDSGKVLQENPSGLPLQPGHPFALDAERESLRQLFRTGDYEDLVAQAVTVPGGLRLDFVVRHSLYVSKVTVEGLKEPPTESAAASALQLGLGEPFRESEMPAALSRLSEELREEGLYQAKLTYHLTPHPDTRQMDIAIDVDQGLRARVGDVKLTNQTQFNDSQLRDRLKLQSKTEITSSALDRATENLRKWLVARDYLGANVSITRGAYDAASNQVPLGVQVVAAQRVRVVVEGMKISSGTLKRLLPLYQEGAVDDDLLQEGRRNLRDYLQGQGYFDADVNYTSSQAPTQTSARPAGEETITYDVNRGTRQRLVGFAFEGNQYFSDDILVSRVHIQPAGFASRGRFSSQQLASDVASLIALYQANGYLRAQVKSELMPDYRGKQGDLYVRFQVQEGAQTRIAKLVIEGNQALKNDEISRVLGSTAGQPYSDFNVAGDRDNVLALYYNQGFPEAQFRSTVEDVSPVAAGDGLRVNLTYQIDEGRQLRVANVLVSGYEHTRPGVIRREIQFQAGQPLSEEAVVETQRRLYDLGIFSRVSIAPQNPAGADPDKTMDVLVEEARRYTIGYGLGLEVQRLGSASNGPTAEPLRFSPRVTLEFTKLNLTGRADSLSFKARASTLQGQALLTYNHSNLFSQKKLSLQVTGLYDKTRDVLTFTSTREEGSVQLTDKVSLTTSFVFRYVYRKVQASDLQVEAEEIPLFSQPTDVSFFSAAWVRDRRDNAADPSRGNFNTVDVDLAARAIASSANFLRATFQNSTFSPIGRKFTFARSTRLGIEHPLGETVAEDIPLPERFFAGGGTTLRGFGLNQAGPRDPATGFPVGGLAMLIFNQQLQFPMRLPLIGTSLSGGVFYDAGNVFSTFSQISLRKAPALPVFDASQANLCVYNCSNTLNYFSHTVGFEFRYHTPVGPVSIDLAYQLNPAQFLVPTNSSAPNGLTMLSRLPSFQFFVNLGSTF